ncbi:MAG: hypothetical protein AB7F99_16185 [Vicinamibacterales bacterium]
MWNVRRTACAAGVSLLLAPGARGSACAQEASSPPAGVPMTREGSGTSWLPDDSPMHALHARKGAWDLMLHGSGFLQYLRDDGPRGQEQGGSVNWIMGMARRPAGIGRLGLKTMISLEPLTIPGCGYPDLLASGESCDGRPIVDRQHPHDLFMELAAVYERPLWSDIGVQIYGGPVGEPALGPVAYPHRVSAMANPLAPISHHWLDATHITFGVVTAGVHGRAWKLEGSFFNGREPDEDRYDFDLGALDSYSGRFWLLAGRSLAFQVSAGRLHDAEVGHDGARLDVDRITASATYQRAAASGPGFWSSTVAWGRNNEAGEATAFVLAESTVSVADRHMVFGRLDAGRKDARDLDLEDLDGSFTIVKVQAGYAHSFPITAALELGVGGSVTLSVVPDRLGSVYGGRTTPGAGLFLSLRPRGMMMTADAPHH